MEISANARNAPRSNCFLPLFPFKLDISDISDVVENAYFPNHTIYMQGRLEIVIKGLELKEKNIHIGV